MGRDLLEMCLFLLLIFLFAHAEDQRKDANCRIENLSNTPLEPTHCPKEFIAATASIGNGKNGCASNEHQSPCSVVHCCALQVMFDCYLQAALHIHCSRNVSLVFAQAQSTAVTLDVRNVFATNFRKFDQPNCGLENPEHLIYYYGKTSSACTKEFRTWIVITCAIISGIVLLLFGFYWCLSSCVK